MRVANTIGALVLLLVGLGVCLWLWFASLWALYLIDPEWWQTVSVGLVFVGGWCVGRLSRGV